MKLKENLTDMVMTTLEGLNLIPQEEPKSTFAKECEQYGLIPHETSIHKLECAKYNLNPQKASVDDLIKAGSQLYKR